MSKRMQTWALRIALTALIVLCAVPAGIAEGAQGEAADLLFTGGVIYTVDEADSIAQALATKDGKIIFVGTDEDAAAFAGEATEVIDLEGRMMLPGFTDSHIHSITLDFFDFSLLGIETAEEAFAVIRDYVEANPDKEVYNGVGYIPTLFEGEEFEKGPRKEYLDEICPDKPMFIYSFDFHTGWVNSKYFEAHGITKDTPTPPGGIIEKDAATGELWGTLKDSASALGGDMQYDSEMLLGALMDFQAILNSYGYTGLMTLPGYGNFAIPFEGYQALADEGNLTIRVTGAGAVMSWRYEEDIALLLETKEKYNSEMLKLSTAKFFMDGVLDGRGAYLLEPYSDLPDTYGDPGWALADLQDAYTQLNTLGIQTHTHAIGDAAARLALDGLEYAKEHAPAGDYRNAITHLQLVAPEDIGRFAQLDVVAVPQPYWFVKAPLYWEEVEYVAIGDRSEHMYPVKSLLDIGVTIASSSDYPVTVDPNPFLAIEKGVTRNLSFADPEVQEYGVTPITDMDDPTYLLWPEERISVADMIRSFTINGAYLTFAEDITGSLEVGKAADLIIISQNILEVNPLEISKTEVLATYLAGVPVYVAE